MYVKKLHLDQQHQCICPNDNGNNTDPLIVLKQSISQYVLLLLFK